MLYFAKKALLLGLESSYGQGVALNGLIHAVQGLDVSITPMEGEELQREISVPFFGGKPKLMVGVHVSVEFGLELAGSGTAGVPPAFGAALRACGFAETIVSGPNTIGSLPTPVGAAVGTWSYSKGGPYTGPTDRTVTITCTGAGGSGGAVVTVSAPADANHALAAYEQTGIGLTDGVALALPDGASLIPTITSDFAVGDSWTIALYAPRVDYEPVSTDPESAAISFFMDRIHHRLLGARGSVSLDITSKKFPTLKCQFKGLYQPPAEQALPPVDYSGFIPPKEVSTEHTTRFQVHDYSGPMESLALNINSAVEARFMVGFEGILITGREPNGSIKLDAPPLSKKNFFVAAKNGDLAPLFIQHGKQAGNIVEVSCPNAQVMAPKYGESQGIVQFEMGIEPKPLAGDDEVKITFR